MSLSFLEVVGFAWITFTCIVGHYVIGRCAWRGGKAAWDSGRLERQAQVDFERKVGLGQ